MSGRGATECAAGSAAGQIDGKTQTAPLRMPFCTRCHRVASDRQDICCWCGSTELTRLTFGEISAHFQGLIGDWIVAGRRAEAERLADPA